MNVTVWRNYFPAAILLGACADSVTAAEPYRYLNEVDLRLSSGKFVYLNLFVVRGVPGAIKLNK